MNTQELKKKSLRISVVEGIFAGGMTGFTQEYFTPFLLLLGGNLRQVGMLSALPNLFASLAQLRSADVVERLNSRKRMINIFVFLQAVMLIPMAVLAIFRQTLPAVFIGLVVLFTCCGALAGPAWGSLMSDLVEQHERGRYFGWRNRLIGFTSVGAMFIAGLLLYIFKRINVFAGFGLLFFAAFIWRMISWRFLRKMYEPPLHNDGNNNFSFLQFISRLRESNFAKFVLFVALMNFSVNIASPFFAVLMLKDLHFNYFLYTIITLTATLTIYCAVARWGRHADRAGNLKIIKITAPLIGLIPLLWVVNRSPLYLIGAQIFSGFLWAGFNLCASNFIYDAVSPEKRTRCIAYFNTLNGAALCAGAFLGGFLLLWLPPLGGYRILTLFAVSALLRLCAGVFLPRQLREVRHVENIKSEQLFFSMIGIRPILGIERKTISY